MLWRKWKKLGSPPLVFSAESNCYPGIAYKYPNVTNPPGQIGYYVNGGQWMGLATALIPFLEEYERETALHYCDADTDQCYLSELVLKLNLTHALDRSFVIMASMFPAPNPPSPFRDVHGIRNPWDVFSYDQSNRLTRSDGVVHGEDATPVTLHWNGMSKHPAMSNDWTTPWRYDHLRMPAFLRRQMQRDDLPLLTRTRMLEVVTMYNTATWTVSDTLPMVDMCAAYRPLQA